MRDEAIRLLKYRPPSLPAGFVQRDRLSNAVIQGLSRRMTSIVAPAGYGKSSLLSSVAQRWSQHGGRNDVSHVAWFQFDGSEDDPAVFVEGLVAAVGGVIPGFGLPTLLALAAAPDPGRDVDRLLSTFLTDLERSGEGRIALVLDDFHLLTNASLLETIERHLVARRCGIHLIVSSRSPVPFYLAGLRGRREIAELSGEDLRFTVEEVRELMHLEAGSRTSEAVLEGIFRETKGWPSFAALAALMTRANSGVAPIGRMAPTEHNHARLVSQLVALLPHDRRQPLLRSSLLPFLDADGCANERLMGHSNGITSFVREWRLPATSPVATDSPLKYDSLFRQALQRELEHVLPREEYRALQCESAAYCESRGEWFEAVRRYLEAGESELAADAVERAADRELSAGHMQTILKALSLLPAHARRSHPGLIVEEAKLMLAKGGLDEARALLATAKIEMHTRGDEVAEAKRLGAWALLLVREGQYDEARQSVSAALSMLPERKDISAGELLLLSSVLEETGDLKSAHDVASKALLIAERDAHSSQIVDALAQLGKLAHSLGRLDEALAMTAGAVSKARSLGRDPIAVSLLGGLASSAYRMRGHVGEAVAVAEKSLEKSAQIQDGSGRARALLSLSLAQDRLGRTADASGRMREAVESLASRPPCSPDRIAGFRAEAVHLLRRGEKRRGVEAARKVARAAEECGRRVLADESRLVAAAGELSGVAGPAQVLLSLRRLAGSFRDRGSLHWYMAALLLSAQAQRRLGMKGAARESLEQSIQLAAKEGYMGMPLDLPVDARGLLDLFVREDLPVELVPALVSTFQLAAHEALEPLLADGNAEIRMRAERVAAVIDSGAGVTPIRYLWPAISSEVTEEQPRMSLRTFGSFQSSLDGRGTSWPSLDAKVLAAYLLVNRREEIPTGQLMKDLWPDLAEPSANLNLRVALYKLAESFGPVYASISEDPDPAGSITWDGAGCETDVDLFLDAVKRARVMVGESSASQLPDGVAADLQAAVDLYVGEFMEDVRYAWTESLRENLRSRLLWATRALVRHHFARREWAEVVENGLVSLRSDPLQEDVVRDVMISYYQLGNRDAVLHQYRELKRLLARERGEWPSEETRRLRVRLLGK